MSTGRSPYPTRSRRRQQAMQNPPNSGGGSGNAGNAGNAGNGASNSNAINLVDFSGTPGSRLNMNDTNMSMNVNMNMNTHMDDSMSTSATATRSSLSPRHSLASGAGSHVSSSGYRLGQSLVQARLSVSPRHSTAAGTTIGTAIGTTIGTAIGTSTGTATRTTTSTTTSSAQGRRFFDNSTMSPPPAQTSKISLPSSTVAAASSTSADTGTGAHHPQLHPKEEAEEDDDIRDGMNITQLRALVQSCMGHSTVTAPVAVAVATTTGVPVTVTAASPSMAVWYASLVYSKTREADDAVVYAQTLWHQGHAKRCVRLLEQAGLFSATTIASWSLKLEAALLASQALASLDEWNSVLALLEDLHLYQPSGSTIDPTGTTGTGTSTMMALEDDDVIAWQQLGAHFEEHEQQVNERANMTRIHPLARICGWRGQAYAETGHPLRAATFYQRALQLDVQCVHAFDGLLDQSLQTPQQALQCVLTLEFTHDQEWLRNLYLARVHVAAPTTTTSRTLSTNPSGRDTSDGDGDGDRMKTTSSMTSMNYPNHHHNHNHNQQHYHHQGGENKNNDDDPASFWHDTSSIQMNQHDSSDLQLLTPIVAKRPGDDNDADDGHGNHEADADNSNSSFFGRSEHQQDNSTIDGPPQGQGQGQWKNEDSAIMAEVEGALEKLLTVHKLGHSSEVLAMAAQRAYRQSNLPLALERCRTLSQMDPLCTTAGYVHVATLVALGHKRSLFRLAHEWVDANPKSSRGWFAVGSYYFACGRYHVAQRHYCRATRLDPSVVEAWIAFGSSFAACDESDQALASFRAAQRLAPGDPTSLLYIGMEYLRTNHASLAHHFLQAAHRASRGTSRLTWNELGVWHLQQQHYEAAIGWFVQALGGSDSSNSNTRRRFRSIGSNSGGADRGSAMAPSCSSLDEYTFSNLLDTVVDPYWEPTVFNLATALRKHRQFSLAILCLERCLTLSRGASSNEDGGGGGGSNNHSKSHPRSSQPKHQSYASALSALGFCHHLRGHLDDAIDVYHQALSIKPDDPFCSELLQRALTDALDQTTIFFDRVVQVHPGDTGEEAGGGTGGASVSLFTVGGVLSSAASSTLNMGGRPSTDTHASYLTEDGLLSLSVDTTTSDIDMG